MVSPSRGDESIGCDCPKYAARPGQSPNTAVRCQDCGHYKSLHDGSDEDTEIEPIVKDIMKKCQAEIGTLPKARETKVEATNEALSGLKKDIERTKSVVLMRTTWRRKRGRPVDKVEKQINLRSVAMIVDGFDGNDLINRCLVHVEPEKLSADHSSRTGTKDRAAVPAAGQD
ncbi:hypothetical protein JB92DRAFT_3108740 [Gautieria morchelliformis]|nr:hypothetical protein JB92DRAFT_3108740 [Gautieria morchelliformis]